MILRFIARFGLDAGPACPKCMAEIYRYQIVEIATTRLARSEDPYTTLSALLEMFDIVG